MFLKKNITIEGIIEVITGLHIGAGSEKIEIGGMDNPVIKNPHTGEPYIPGSSLKGKMRSLMEWKYDKSKDGKVHQCEDKDEARKCKICTLFGAAGENNYTGPTRLIFRDAKLTEKSRNDYVKRGLTWTEEKRENTINRITAEANPRHMERVVAGVEFDLQIIYRFFEEDLNSNDRDYILQALALLQEDALGGSISRGYGQIKFKDLKYDGVYVANLQSYINKPLRWSD